MTIFTPAEQSLLDRAEAFARDRVAPAAPAWERERRLGLDALREAAGLGFTGVEVPTACGGLGHRFACKVALCERLAAADFGFAMSLVNTHNVAARLARDAPAGLARRYLPELLAGTRLGCTALTEPGAGSDFAAITTTARRTAAGWQLDGTKAWITNAAVADVIVLYAQTEPGSGGRGIAGFVVDGRRPGFAREAAFALAGQHTIGTGGFRLDGYVARDDELISPPGTAFKAALRSINGARTYIAAMCNGMVGTALRVAWEHGEQRHAFGRPLAAHQGWRWPLAEAGTELEAGRALVARAIRAVEDDAGAPLAAAQAKLYCTRMAERQLPRLAQAMGAEGLREHHPFGRHLVGARVASFVDGSSEMLLERIAALQRPRGRDRRPAPPPIPENPEE
jgi:alkylation response protein AidB-like acyl-CoA dehydrogenase